MVSSRSLTRHGLSLMLALVFMLTGGLSGIARADQPAPDDAQLTGTVQVSGDVRAPTMFTLDALRALPARTESVTFGTDAGPQSHTYAGCQLDALITATDPNVDVAAKHPLLTVTVLATGADGYAAAVAWAEIAPTLSARPALVAYTEDGKPLPQPRLVLPGDIEGARYVSDLTDLRVVNLAHA
jgi:DMSO/TMAO reductase YedYZ molybdopterin-dependent catalytic subunit